MDKKKAMESLAKRPALFTAMKKGGTIPQLKTAGGCSGGYIRSLVKAGVADINDGIVKLKSAIDKSDLPKVSKHEIVATEKKQRERVGDKAERIVKTTEVFRKKSRKERKAEIKQARYCTLKKDVRSASGRIIKSTYNISVRKNQNGKWIYNGPYSQFEDTEIAANNIIDRESFFQL